MRGGVWSSLLVSYWVKEEKHRDVLGPGGSVLFLRDTYVARWIVAGGLCRGMDGRCTKDEAGFRRSQSAAMYFSPRLN